jgi:hypothetical protein
MISEAWLRSNSIKPCYHNLQIRFYKFETFYLHVGLGAKPTKKLKQHLLDFTLKVLEPIRSTKCGYKFEMFD